MFAYKVAPYFILRVLRFAFNGLQSTESFAQRLQNRLAIILSNIFFFSQDCEVAPG